VSIAVLCGPRATRIVADQRGQSSRPWSLVMASAALSIAESGVWADIVSGVLRGDHRSGGQWWRQGESACYLSSRPAEVER